MEDGTWHIETPWDKYEEAMENMRNYYQTNQKSKEDYLNGKIGDEQREKVRKEYAELSRIVDLAEGNL